MDLYTLDFETYYDKDYSLSKLNTEEYVRDERFESILLGIKKNDKPCGALRGADEIRYGLKHLKSRLEKSAVAAHHAQFDGFILSHHFGIRPARWYDTLSMSRGIYGSNNGNSLGKLAQLFGLGAKGTEVMSAIGKRFADFTPDELERYVGYCCQDVELTYALLVNALRPQFPRRELVMVDRTVRMFTEPHLLLDAENLERYVETLRADRVRLVLTCGVDRKQLMSNPKFAAVLEQYGVEPPMKVSPTTGKPTYAFAKTDEGMKALLEHPDETVQLLVAARLGNKSTINETRAIRMAAMGRRGPAPIYLKYSGAGQTHRLSGGDKMNWQNLSKTRMPRDGDQGRLVVAEQGVGVLHEVEGEGKSAQLMLMFPHGSEIVVARDTHLFGLRDSIYAPPGKTLVVADSSNIESRVLDMLAGQEDAVQRYVDKKDPYIHLASQIYGRLLNKQDNPDERQLGKVAKLGLGFGMGAPKFQATAKNWGIKIDAAMAQRVVDVYRNTHYMIPKLWKQVEACFPYMVAGIETAIDPAGIVHTIKDGIMLPNGLTIRYPELRKDSDGWTYWAGKFRTNIYGGKCVENIVQALARIIVGEQLVAISKRYWVAHFIHDETVEVVDEAEGHAALAFSIETMSTSPVWWPGIPLAAEGAVGKNYGGCK